MIRVQLCFLSLLITGFLGAQDLRVEYMEGTAQASINQKWVELDFGTKLTAAQSIKVGAGSKVVVQAPSYRIYLSKPGTYALPELVASWEKTQGGQSWIAGKIQNMIAPRPSKGDNVGGARAGFDFSVALDEKDLELLNPSLAKLQSGDYSKAATLLEEVLDNAPEEREGKVLFYLAYAQDLKGDKIQALKSLDPVMNYQNDPRLFPSMALLKARILMDKGDVEPALAWIDKVYGLLTGEGTKQGLKFIEALCWQSLNQSANRNKALNAIMKIDPTSDIAVLAGTLLK